MSTATTFVTASQQAAGISPAGIGLSIAAVGLIGGLALAMHHRKKSPRIIGWLCFFIGIPLAALLSGLVAWVAGLTLWSIPVLMIIVGYVAFVFLHDGIGKKGKPHRLLQPIFGLILPALLLTLGGSVGSAIHSGLDTIDHGVGSVVSTTTGR